jgi:predicted Rossmann fold flavoprotein
MTRFDAIILGAGAAGLMCAATAGKRGRRVLLLDHAPEAGRKILISGGGRCNFTNLGTAPDRSISGNRHFARSALARFTPRDVLAMVERHRIAWHEKTLGQLFCDGSARQIVRMLLDECIAGGVDLRLNHQIREVSRGDAFVVETDRGSFTAPALVLATGGLSIPKLGATGLSHNIATRFGLKLTGIRPGLVPLTFAGEALELISPLSGLALPVRAKAGTASFDEAMLFTHRGLSGPAILQISSYWHPGEEIVLDLLPGQKARELLLFGKTNRPRAELRTVLGELVPQRLATALAPDQGKIGELPNKRIEALAQTLSGWRLTPSGTEGYAKAEVTLGGIDTAGLSSQTMMANDVPGLFAVGEAVDVTGWLGGYNFQWAWASGFVAGAEV